MSRLQELLDQYCPDGVEVKSLGSVCKITSGEFVKKDKQVENGYPVYNGGTTNTGFYGDYNTVGPKVIISARGAAGFVNYVDGPFWAGNSCHVMNIVDESLIVRYLYHVMKSLEQKIISKRQDGSIPSVSQKQLYEMSIPAPPVEVQQEIVRILDSFTELTTELTTELAARRKQYEYYRDALLDFDNADPNSWLGKKMAKYCPNGVKCFPLEQCCATLDNKRKPVTKYAREIGEYPYYGANGIQDYVSDYIFDGRFVLVGEDGSVVTEKGTPVVTWAEGKIWVNNHAHIIAESESVSLRYLFHYLQTVNVKPLIHGNIPKLTGKDFRALSIPVPPLELQREIVKVLDRFSSLCSDVSEGLPAEIAARQKQYEYYRDRLLSF